MLAGVSKRQLSPKVGHGLVGYGNRTGVSQGIHDPIWVRAIAITQGETTIVMCSIELCYLRPPELQTIQTYIAEHSSLTASDLLITTTHTHSAPAAHEADAWEHPFIETVGDAIIEAYDNRQSAKIGIGAGFLYGYSINRRWLDRPIDPAVHVIRIDTATGLPLAIVGNFACHPVVLGYDNLLISGDWAGYASRQLEEHFDVDFVAMVTQGGSGDINPLTETVRQRLQAGHPVSAIGDLTTYYGHNAQPEAWNIGDRKGGTFEACAILARAYNDEVLRVWQQISMRGDTILWTKHLSIDATLAPDDPPQAKLPEALQAILPDLSDYTMQLDMMIVGIDHTLITTQPGEAFSETAVDLRKMAQQLGYHHAILMTYANGSYGYLPPENAFAEGGYEVIWPLGLGISRHLQARIRQAIHAIIS
jgi:neutral ceramidase